MSVPGKRRNAGLLIAAMFGVATAIAIGATSPVAVKATARNEAGPAAAGDWFAWSRSRERQASPFDLYAQRSGGKPFRVNAKGTQAYAGGIDGTTLVYQVIRGQLAAHSDLRLFDLATRRHLRIPRGIDTNGWECCATISGDWLLFSRGHSYSADRQLVLLRNLRHGRAARPRHAAEPQGARERGTAERHLRRLGPLRPVPAVPDLPLRHRNRIRDGASRHGREDPVRAVGQRARHARTTCRATEAAASRCSS